MLLLYTVVDSWQTLLTALVATIALFICTEFHNQTFLFELLSWIAKQFINQLAVTLLWDEYAMLIFQI